MHQAAGFSFVWVLCPEGNSEPPKCRVITESRLYFRNLPLAVLWGVVWSGKGREGREMAPEARARGHVVVGETASGTMGMKKGK